MRLIAAICLGLISGLLPHTAQAQSLTGYQRTAVAPSAPRLTDPSVQVFPLEDALPQAASAKTPSYETARSLRKEMPPPADGQEKGGTKAPVDFEADNLQHDEAAQTITATGNVRLVQSGRVMKADRMVYNLVADTVRAEGNIVMTDKSGDVHFAKELELSNEMKQGFVRGVQTYLAAGGRFTASEGRRVDETKTVMTDASYTPCDCEDSDAGEPAWQIKAGKVTHDEKEGRISYKDAKFEIYGVPVLYTPYFAHSDGKVKQKSGLLTPGFGFNSQLGYQLTNEYYWGISPDKDATVGVIVNSKQSPVLTGEYRQRFANADLEVSGSVTNSDYKDSIGILEETKRDEWRGHMFADGRWDINDKWRAGTELELTSDDQYLRQYDFSGKDVLENEVYAERFSGRNYAVIRALGFQDVRVGENRRDQPNILPEVTAQFTGEPKASLGGRWYVEASALGLTRTGCGQDMNRAVLTGNWERKFTSDTGLVTTVDVAARGDYYSVSDREDAAAGESRSGTQTRFFPQANMLTSYPLARPFEKMQAIIEPTIALTIAPNVNVEDSAIPNEDSQDAQIDALNLFVPSRFPGKDRLEDRSRVTYGIRTGLYGYQGSYLDLFAGQSYRFHEDDNPFPRGSGLNEQESDLVGQVAGLYDGRIGLNYRFQLASENMSSQRHELDGYLTGDGYNFTTRYLYAKALAGTDISESREQIQNVASVDLTDRWRLNAGALYDMGDDSGLRKAAAGLDYFGCCMTFSVLAERNYTDDESGDSNTDIKFSVGLRDIGQIQSGGTSFWSLSDRYDD